MDDSEVKTRQQLTTAGELFMIGKYAQCRKVLGEIKTPHASIDLNLIISEYKESPSKAPQLAKKLFDALANKPPTPEKTRIPHELYYWNAVVLAVQSGKPEAAEFLAQEGLRFQHSMRTETSLMLLYHLLNTRERAGRLASCLVLAAKVQELAGRVRQLGESELVYRFLSQVLFTRVLLKLGIIEASKVIFMMHFNQSPEKGEQEIPNINGIPSSVYQQHLHAEIEFHSGNHQQSIRILSELLPIADTLGKNRELIRTVIDHNIALVLAQQQKPTVCQLLLRKTMKYLSNTEELEQHSQRQAWINKCKQNTLLAALLNNSSAASLYDLARTCSNLSSFKLNYRKAEACLKYYHELLEDPKRVLVSKEVHDTNEPTYFHPNQPYFQQKGKNKNPAFSAGKSYYRRYVLPEWEDDVIITNDEESKDKKKEKEKEKEKSTTKNGKQNKKEEETTKEQTAQVGQDPHRAKLSEILNAAEGYLKHALVILQKQRNVVVRMEGEEQGLSQQVNQYFLSLLRKLHYEYIEYKSSIFSILTYVHLSQHRWTQALQSADSYLSFARLHHLHTRSPAHQQAYFSAISHRVQALTHLARMPCAYEAMQEAAAAVEYSDNARLKARSTANQQAGQCYIEEMSQYTNLCFNVAVLHSHDNKIPQAFQAIQKVLQQLRVVPSSPQARLPLSAIELLTHYNLRTTNAPSALQLIKRRRILSLPGTLSHHPPILSITK